MATGLSVDFTFHNVSVESTTSGYGIQLNGNCPVILCNILRGSVSERAGIKAGDYLITFNGNDVQESTEDDVGILLQESYGSPLKLRVARPHPVPVSSLDKRRALLTLQNKLRTGAFVTCGAEVDNYRSQLNNALSEVDEILGGFNIPQNQLDPSYGGTDQEVEIQMYDIDNLSSPPSSAGSDNGFTNYDRLLDFSKQDRLDHHPGFAGAEMNKSMQKMQKEIKNMKDIMKDVSDKKVKKQKAREQTMRTEAVFTPSYPSNTTRTRPSATASPKHTLDQELAELEQLQEQIQWVSSPIRSSGLFTSGEDSTSRQVPKRTGRSPPPQQSQVKENPIRQSEKNTSPSALTNEQILSSQYNKQQQSTSSSKEWSEQRKPKKSFKGQEKSPPIGEPKSEKPRPVREPKRAKSPPVNTSQREKLQQPVRTNSPSAGQPSRTKAVSPTNKEPGRLERFFRRSKSPPLQAESSRSPPAETPVFSGDKFSVPLRHKKNVSDHVPGLEASGYVDERRKTSKMSFGSPSSKSPEKLLPTLENVTFGLSDNSRTLLRLSSSKLKAMGITNAMHCRVLATEIGKLKIHQEQAELRELQFDSDDETGIVTDL